MGFVCIVGLWAGGQTVCLVFSWAFLFGMLLCWISLLCEGVGEVIIGLVTQFPEELQTLQEK